MCVKRRDIVNWCMVCMVYTKPVPRWQQFHMAPAMQNQIALSVHHCHERIQLFIQNHMRHECSDWACWRAENSAIEKWSIITRGSHQPYGAGSLSLDRWVEVVWHCTGYCFHVGHKQTDQSLESASSPGMAPPALEWTWFCLDLHIKHRFLPSSSQYILVTLVNEISVE